MYNLKLSLKELKELEKLLIKSDLKTLENTRKKITKIIDKKEL